MPGNLLLQLRRIALNLLLQQLALRDIPHEGAGMQQPPAFGIQEGGRVNLHINGRAVPGEKDRLDGAAAVGHQAFQIGQDLGLPPLRNDVPQAHPLHVLMRISQLFQLCLVDMHKQPGLVQLVDHFRGVLDQIPIFLLQPANIAHALLKLTERLSQIGGHAIEGIGQVFDLIPGFHDQLVGKIAGPDVLRPFMENPDRPGDPSGHHDAGPP